MKANNEKQEVEETIEMNDLDYITDILETTKNMVNNYSYALNEISNEYVYKEYKKIFDDTSNAQRKLFELMFKKGWYCLESVNKQNINKAFTKYNNQLEQL